MVFLASRQESGHQLMAEPKLASLTLTLGGSSVVGVGFGVVSGVVVVGGVVSGAGKCAQNAPETRTLPRWRPLRVQFFIIILLSLGGATSRRY